jgi:hypothetical protein
MNEKFRPRINIIKKATILLCITIWVVVAWRMQWHQLLIGNVPLLDFDTYHQTAIDTRLGRHPLSLPYMQTGGPPSVIIPYLPFSFLPLQLARSLMSLGSILAIWLTGWIMARSLHPRHKYFWTLIYTTLLLLPFPTRFNLGQGQPNLWLMAGAAHLISNSTSSVGAWIAGLIIIVKTNYLIMMTSFWRSKFLLFTLGVVILFLTISSPVIKPQYYVDFIQRRLFQTTFQSAQIIDVDYYNQSLKSTLGRFGLSDWYMTIFLISGLLSLSYLITHESDLSSGILLSLLLSPLLWQHYVVVIYPLAIFLLRRLSPSTPLSKLILFLGLLLICLEFPWLHGQPASFFNSLLASHFFIGICLILIISLRVSLFHPNSNNRIFQASR